MQAKQRYILVFLCCAFLALCYFGGYRLKNVLASRASRSQTLLLDSYIDAEEVMEPRTWAYSPRQGREAARSSTSKEKCRMETCFDFSKCSNGFKVFVHPPDGNNSPMSSTYKKILNVIMESR